MNTNNLIQAISAGICLYAGIVHLLIGLRREPRYRIHSPFAGISLLYSIYSVNLFFLYAAIDSGSVTRFVSTDKWGLAVYYLAFASQFLFIAAYTGIKHRFVVWVPVALYSVIAMSNFILPYTWVYTNVELSNASDPVLTLSPWYTWEGPLTALLFVVYSTACIVRQYRHGERTEARVLAIAAGIFVSTYIWDIVFVEYGLVPFILLQQYGFVAFIIIMSLRLTRQIGHTEKALIAEKEFTETLLDAQTDTLFVFDPHTGKALRWNRAFKDVSGYTDAEIAAKKAPDAWYSQEDLQKAAAATQLASQQGHATVEMSLITKSGNTVPFEYSGGIINDPQGRPQYIISIGRDITERKRAEEALRKSAARFRAIFHNAPIAMAELDMQGHPLLNNMALQRMVGYTADELAGMLFTEFTHPEDADADMDLFRELIDGTRQWYQMEKRYLHKDGRLVWGNLYVTLLRDKEGQPQTIIGMAVDITARKQAEEALRQSEERLRRVVESMPVMMNALDEDSNVIAWNRECERVTGYSAAEMVGNPHSFEMLYPDAAYRERMITELTDLGFDFRDKEYTLTCKDGTKKTISWSNISARYPIPGWYTWAIGMDVTERKRTEEELRKSEERYRELFNNMSSGVAVYEAVENGQNFIFKDFNQSGERIENIRKDDLLGKSVVKMFPGVRDFGLFEVFQRVWQTGEPEHHPISLYQDKRIVGWRENYVYKLPSGEIVAVYDDVTERKQAEEELQQHRKHLEELVKERTAELEQARKAALNLMQDAHEQRQRAEDTRRAAETANRAKSEFLANMSHELRTPLNAILGFAQLMQRDAALTDAQREHLEIITRSGEHLLRLINDVLDMSKIEAGQITFNPQSFDLYRTLTSIEEMVRVRAEGKGLEFTVTRSPDIPQYIKTDESKLRQILINLLSNAVKFTEEGKVVLRIVNCELRNEPTPHPSQEGKSEIRNLKFEIEDTGIGIAPDEIETIFDTFRRTQQSERIKEGTGLGLAISRKFVRFMGGDIHVESDIGKGSRFSFNILVEAADMSDIQAVKLTRRVIGLEPNQPIYRILVVEDHLENRLFLTQLLQTVGFEVHEATNGQEALKHYESWQPHLIWMDIRMPVMDGYAATRKIRKAEEQKSRRAGEKPTSHPSQEGNQSVELQASIPIIALTASAFEEDRKHILEAGCDDVVRKPLQDHEIFEMIHIYLGVRYVYEESSKVASSKIAGSREQEGEQQVLTPETLAALPGDVVANLEHATLDGDVKLIDQVIHEIHNHNAALADALAHLAHEFDYDTILKLIQEGKNYKNQE